MDALDRQHEAQIEVIFLASITELVHHEADRAAVSLSDPAAVLMAVSADPCVDAKAPDLVPEVAGESIDEGAFRSRTDEAPWGNQQRTGMW